MNYSIFFSVFALVLSLSLFSCDKESTEVGQLFWINKERVACQGFIPQTCYLVQKDEILGTNWEFFYDPIEGFDDQYEEGFIYQIEVAVTDVENPPQDASSLAYKLIQVISKEQ